MFRENTLKRDLAEGKMVSGCAVMSRSPIIVEMLGYTGFDWLFIDTEHVPIGSDTDLEHLIRAAEASNIVPIVRVKENREQYIRNALEAGAQGVVVPHVATKEDAEKAVKHARFPLKGIRGADPTVRSARYRCGDFDWDAFIKASNKTDYGLSLGLNLLYDFNHPKIVEAFEAVVEGSKKKGLPILSAVNPCTVEQSKKLSDMGVNFQLFGSDIGLISSAFQDVMVNVVSKVR